MSLVYTKCIHYNLIELNEFYNQDLFFNWSYFDMLTTIPADIISAVLFWPSAIHKYTFKKDVENY